MIPVCVQLIILKGQPRTTLSGSSGSVYHSCSLLWRQANTCAIEKPILIQPQWHVPLAIAASMHLYERLPAEEVRAILAKDLCSTTRILRARKTTKNLLALPSKLRPLVANFLVGLVRKQDIVNLTSCEHIRVDGTRQLLALHRRVVLSLSAGVRLGKALQGEEVLALVALHPCRLRFNLGAHDDLLRLVQDLHRNLLLANLLQKRVHIGLLRCLHRQVKLLLCISVNVCLHATAKPEIHSDIDIQQHCHSLDYLWSHWRLVPVTSVQDFIEDDSNVWLHLLVHGAHALLELPKLRKILLVLAHDWMLPCQHFCSRMVECFLPVIIVKDSPLRRQLYMRGMLRQPKQVLICLGIQSQLPACCKCRQVAPGL
mmetsp:Transcript_2564/g.6520  ORF Transcript_2564/g.6520 Transcript_2564/m.6520 type:complete len:371 (-) Transcript_2564:89-1201(-)